MDSITCFVWISPFNVSRKIQKRGDKDDNADTGDTLATGLVLPSSPVKYPRRPDYSIFLWIIFIKKVHLTHQISDKFKLITDYNEPSYAGTGTGCEKSSSVLTFIEKEIFQIWGRVQDSVEKESGFGFGFGF